MKSIESKRLTLVPLTEERITPKYVAWLNDKELMQYSEQRHKSHSMVSCLTYLHSFKQTPNLFYAIVAHDVDLGHVGNIIVYRDLPNAVAELSILIGEKCAHGQGFGLEAWQCMIDYLFADGVRKITAGTMSKNIAMLRIFEKSGMHIEGRRQQQLLCHGELVDYVLSAIFNEQG